MIIINSVGINYDRNMYTEYVNVLYNTLYHYPQGIFNGKNILINIQGANNLIKQIITGLLPTLLGFGDTFYLMLLHDICEEELGINVEDIILNKLINLHERYEQFLRINHDSSNQQRYYMFTRQENRGQNLYLPGIREYLNLSNRSNIINMLGNQYIAPSLLDYFVVNELGIYKIINIHINNILCDIFKIKEKQLEYVNNE